ncbi:hypothetical protein ACIUXR_29840 [Pseudomonas aeruginosa]
MSKELNKAPVEQAGGDERAAFELFVRKHCGMPEHIAVNWDAKFTNDAWEGWQARAALAQPSPKCNCPGFGKESLSSHAPNCPVRASTAQPSPAQAEQAEAERPEVVGYRSIESGMVYEQDYGLKDPEALTTVAECDRIVGELRADRDSWAEQAEQRLADWDEMRKERDAALARVAELEAKLVRVTELERQEPVSTEHLPMHIAYARAKREVFLGSCQEDVFRFALIDLLQESPLYAAPVAQAQHGVPGKYDDVLLPFLKLMEHELHANAGKGDRPGWLQMDRKTALLEIYYHLGKLQKATKDNDAAGIVEYAADVANMSMMLVDVCGLLAAAPGKEGV